jgi:hypothetical protein
MAVVGFDSRQEPFDRCLVVIVLLALDNDLLHAVDKLVTALFGELIAQEVTGLVVLLVGTVLVLLGDAVANAEDLLTEALQQSHE